MRAMKNGLILSLCSMAFAFGFALNAQAGVTVNGGTARARASVARMFPYDNVPAMTFALNGGLIESTGGAGILYFGYSVSCRAAVDVTGGEIRAAKYGIYAYGTDGNMTVDVTGGKISTALKNASVICLYNYRAALPEKTEVNVSGGTFAGDYVMIIWDYYAATHTTISGGEFSGKFYTETYFW